MGKLHAICRSPEKGTPKTRSPVGVLVADHGLDGDAHAGPWHRQVSLLPLEEVEAFRAKGADVAYGDFGENLVVSGLDWQSLRPGDRIRCGGALLQLTQFGKECHDRCRIYQSMGDCIMPRHGVFARVVEGAAIAVGDLVEAAPALTAVLLTISDKASAGEREDASGPAMRTLVEAAGFAVAAQDILPDDHDAIAQALRRHCDDTRADLVLTSGGTGFSPRDVTPEATLAVVERLCPGIPEAMRAFSLSITSRAILSRAVAGIRGRSLIVNLPGSPRAVQECLGQVMQPIIHGVGILRGDAGECGRPA